MMRPDIVALIFFTITIASINAEAGGLPLNLRALIGVSLFFRALATKTKDKDPSFVSNSVAIMIFVFVIYSFFVTLFYDLYTIDVVKQSGLACISAYLSYFYYWEFRRRNFDFLKFCLIAAGLICFADLAYTYAAYGSFPVQRIHSAMMHMPIVESEEDADAMNHNFFGQICGMCFVYIFNDYINGRIKNKLTLLLFPVMFLGVLMSTSRSALLAIIFICFILVGRELKDKEKAKRVYSMLMFGVGGIFLALFLFLMAQSYLNIDSAFMDEITSRLIDEPVAVINKNLGLKYNAQHLGPMDWREEASSEGWKGFLGLPFHEQITGIGAGGFVYRRMIVGGYMPHNGIILILVEAGMIGLAIYSFILTSIIRKSLKTKTISSLTIILFFFIFYCLGQNGELTSGIAFLFIGSLMAENRYLAAHQEEGALEWSHAQPARA